MTPLSRLEHAAQREAAPQPADVDVKLALIDFGMTARLGTTLREQVVRLLLDLGRVAEACEIALRRLRVSGLRPLGDKRARAARSTVARALANGRTFDGRRLASALLIPISAGAVQALCRQVLRIPSEDQQSDNQPIAA